ncbi:hypothetical protein [Actinoplanes sp. NPDC048796]|uniref:hypothetical protein n=1 Tax=Actinoplanes sp. NPDC048796 TaxID=3155640 RepID=UPI0033FD1A71
MYDVVRQKLSGEVCDKTSIEFSDGGDIAITFETAASGAAEATRLALERFTRLMLSAGLVLEPYAIRTYPSGNEVGPSLVGTSEIAEILDVTKARVSQLIRSDTFPAPVARLAMGPVYLDSAVRSYVRRARRPSRPRRQPLLP